MLSKTVNCSSQASVHSDCCLVHSRIREESIAVYYIVLRICHTLIDLDKDDYAYVHFEKMGIEG